MDWAINLLGNDVQPRAGSAFSRDYILFFGKLLRLYIFSVYSLVVFQRLAARRASYRMYAYTPRVRSAIKAMFYTVSRLPRMEMLLAGWFISLPNFREPKMEKG